MDVPIREKMLRFQMSVPAEEQVLYIILKLLYEHINLIIIHIESQLIYADVYS